MSFRRIAAHLISHCGPNSSLQSSKLGASNVAQGKCRGVGGMHILAFVRGIWFGLMHRYRPELHYMRGPGPKWLERHGGPDR